MTTFDATIWPCKREKVPGSIFTSTTIENIMMTGVRFKFEAANAKEAVAYIQAYQAKVGRETIVHVDAAKGFRRPPGLGKLTHGGVYYKPE